MVRKKNGRIIASVLAAAIVMGGVFSEENIASVSATEEAKEQMSAQAIRRLTIQAGKKSFP